MSKATRIAWGRKDLQRSVAQKAKLKVIKFPNIFYLSFDLIYVNLARAAFGATDARLAAGNFKLFSGLGDAAVYHFPTFPKCNKKPVFTDHTPSLHLFWEMFPNVECVVFKLISGIALLGISWEAAVRWLPMKYVNRSRFVVFCCGKLRVDLSQSILLVSFNY